MTQSLIDGENEIVTTIEPDGRVRVTVWVHGQCIAAPTFSAAAYSQASLETCDELLRLADLKAARG